MIPLGVLGSAHVPAAGGGGAVAGAYVTSASIAANAASYTFTSLALGTASADRRIHVAIAVRKASPSADVTAVTIAGVSATQDVAATDNGSTCAVWSAAVPSGTTGDVVVSTSATVLRCHVYVYATAGAHATPAGTSVPAQTQTAEFSLTSTVDGFAIGITSHVVTTATATWTGATGDAALTAEYNSAAGSTATTATTTDFDAAWSVVTTAYAHAAVAYQPA